MEKNKTNKKTAAKSAPKKQNNKNINLIMKTNIYDTRWWI